jgi:hypothetical protein
MDVRYKGTCAACRSTLTVTLTGVTIDPEGAPYPKTLSCCDGRAITPVRITPYGWTAPEDDEDWEDDDVWAESDSER